MTTFAPALDLVNPAPVTDAPARDRAALEADYAAAPDLDDSWIMSDAEADEWADQYAADTAVESGHWAW